MNESVLHSPFSAGHAVVIGAVWPEPNSSAAGQNMQGLIATLRQHNWQVTFVTAANDSLHKWDLATLDVPVHQVALNCSSFDTLMTELAPQLVVFDRFMTEEQFSWRVRQVCPDAALVLNTEDLHCLRHARHNAVKQHRDVSQAELNNEQACREIAAILRCDLSLIISDYEHRLLCEHYQVPSSMLLHLPLMLPPVSAPQVPFAQRQGFVTIGNFRHAPNWDAVLQLKQQVWPRIRRQLPSARLTVYGAYPPKKATELSNPGDGFVVAGWVEDAPVALAQARVLLAPLRFGAGVKGKLLTAMQCGTPSVTTAIGAEGIGDSALWPGSVVETFDEFAQAAIELHNQPDRWQQSVDRIEAILSAKFDACTISARLMTALDELLGQLAQRRQQHFLQQMLWHHSLRATQYMSQWIEAKNRL